MLSNVVKEIVYFTATFIFHWFWFWVFWQPEQGWEATYYRKKKTFCVKNVFSLLEEGKKKIVKFLTFELWWHIIGSSIKFSDDNIFVSQFLTELIVYWGQFFAVTAPNYQWRKFELKLQIELNWTKIAQNWFKNQLITMEHRIR